MFLANYIFKANIVARDEWKAEKPGGAVKPIEEEISHLVVTYTNTAKCNNKDECTRLVKEIQRKQIQEGKPDIQYNFLIGGDGNVYEGRGWKGAPDYPTDKEEFKELQGRSVEIAFIQDSGTKPTPYMIKAFIGIVFQGLKENLLTKDIKKLKPCVLAGDELIKYNGDVEEDIKKMDKKAITNSVKELLAL